MATTVDGYVSACEELVEAKPEYVTGKSTLKQCDCIGMDKYAFRKLGVPFSTSGTNHSARSQVTGLRKIVGTSDLKIGDVVFKAYEPGQSGYDLPDKYKEGGKEYNGDLRDYYHIGTVKSVYPLRIMHMTKPTAKVDDKIGKWAFVASWNPEYVQPDEEPVPDPEPSPATAEVWSDNGKPVNLRARPSKAAALIDRVPVGEKVELIERAEDWCHVKWKGKVGYMMTNYLILPETILYTIVIKHQTRDEADALKIRYPDAEVIEERG